jgi:hypothetical protein
MLRTVRSTFTGSSGSLEFIEVPYPICVDIRGILVVMVLTQKATVCDHNPVCVENKEPKGIRKGE